MSTELGSGTAPNNVQHSETNGLTNGRRLAHNTLWNLVGQGLPMLVMVVAVPVLIRSLGVARFGALSLGWVVMGYFSLVDLSMGRALTKFAAEKLGTSEKHELGAWTGTALILLALLGAVATLVTALLSPWLVVSALRIPAELQRETLQGFYLLACSIPLITVTNGLRGILEALQAFRILSLIRIPLSLISVLGPLLVLPFSHSLTAIFAMLVAGRLIGCIVHWIALIRCLPPHEHRLSFDRNKIAPLAKFGGWITVGNVIGPIIIYSDRFLIGAILSITAVGYYTVPFDAVTRLWVIPGSVTGVLFPAFAAAVASNAGRALQLLNRGTKYIFLVMFPLVLFLVVFGPALLQLWLGSAFSESSGRVLQWLSAGVLLNSLAQVPYVLLQAAGRPDFTAKLSIWDVLLYLPLLVGLTLKWGIEGAAIACFLRFLVEALVLFLCAYRLLQVGSTWLAKLSMTAGGALAVLVAGSQLQIFAVKALFFLINTLAFAIAGWRWGLGENERIFLTGDRDEKPVQPQSA